MRLTHKIVLGAVLAGVYLGPAAAQQKLKVGYLKTYALLPLYQATNKGYFKDRGLDVELTTLNNGPAVAAGIASGSLDIGYAAVLPIVAARSRGEKFRFFAAASYEDKDKPLTMYVASARSGVASFKDIAGKSVAINTAGGGCELGAQDHTEASGVTVSAMKTISMPFPQMQAALELGNADVACTVDPFFTSIMSSKRIDAKVIATSPIVGDHARIMIDGFFAGEDWLKTHGPIAASFSEALQAGARDLVADPKLIPALLVSELRFSPEIAAKVKIDPVPDNHVEARYVAPLIAAMERRAFITTKVNPDDMVATVTK